MLADTDDGLTKIDTTFDGDTVWLSIDQMAELFQRDRSVIGKHVRNIFKEGELQKESVWAKFAYTAADGKVYDVDYYNLDVIISVGYRVKSKRGTQFRIWATGILAVLSSLLMAFAPGLFLICAAMGLNALSSTMFSGTDAALTYDSLKQAGQEERYLSVAANRSQIGMLASALGSLASTLRRFLRFSGFYLVSALFSSISTLAMLLLKEPVVTEAQAARSSHSLRELPGQFAQLVRDSAAALRGCPLAAKLIAADAVISVPCYLTKMFLQQRLVELGWPTEWLFLPLLLGGAACVAGTEIGRRVHPHTLRRFYTVCALLVDGGTFLVGAAPAWGGILGMMLVQGVLEVWLLHADQRLNALISSDQRATLISVDSMAYSILMIPASPFVGAVGDLFGQAGAGLALLGVLTAASGAAVLAKRRS